VTEWIDIRRSMPEAMRWVLVAHDHGRVDKACFNDGTWWYDAAGSYNDVTHWMPLPDSPDPDRREYCWRPDETRPVPGGFYEACVLELGHDGPCDAHPGADK
jgi:hypothetical protein